MQTTKEEQERMSVRWLLFLATLILIAAVHSFNVAMPENSDRARLVAMVFIGIALFGLARQVISKS